MQKLKGPKPIAYRAAREIVLEAISGRRKRFSSINLHFETGLPFPMINRVLEAFEKEGKIKDHEENY